MGLKRIEQDIIKEAAIGSLAIKAGAKIGSKVGSLALKTGTTIGKNMIKNPLKTTGKLMSTAYIASTVGDVGKASKNAFKNHNMINASNIAPMVTNNISKLAEEGIGEEDFKYTTNKNIDFKYAPHIAAGTIAGLAIASQLTGVNPLTTLAKGSLKGAADVAKTVNAPFRVASKVVRKANNVARTNKKEIEYLARDAARNAKNFTGKPFNIDPNLFKKEIKDELLKELGGINKKTSTSGAILEAIGRGAGFAGGAFAVHSAGDKYLKSKDKDELRSLLRESRDDNPERLAQNVFGKGPKFLEHTYETPKQKAEAIINMDKEAKFKPQKIKAIFTTPLAQDLLATSHRSLINGSVSTVAYLTTSSLKNKSRNKKNGFSNNPDRIVVEIPLSELNKRQRKKADLEEISLEKLSSVHPKIKNLAAKNGRMVLNAMAWVAPGIALAEVKERVQNKKNQDLLPLSPGKARIIIETNNNNTFLDQSHNDAYRMHSIKKIAEEISSAMAKDIKQASIEEQEKVMTRKTRALRNIELYEGTSKKQRMNT